MNILSIVWGPCATAALLVDGEVAASFSEERVSRIKNDDSYPYRAIEAVLKTGNVAPGRLNLVVFSGKNFPIKDILCHKWSRFSVYDRLREQHDYWYPRLYHNKDIEFLEVFKDKIDDRQFPGDWQKTIERLINKDYQDFETFCQEFRRQAIHKHIGIDPKKVVFPNHHLAHASYAYYGSPAARKTSLVLTADGWGDDANATVRIAEDGNLRLLSSSANFMIGRLYRYITLLLGMKPDEHEYKLMGLAAYAKPEYYQGPLKIFENTMYVDGLGFAYREKPQDLYFYFRDRFEGCRFDAIAGALQKYTEDILVKWAGNALKAAGARNVCFAGGVAMNIKAVMEMARLEGLDGIFICPTPSDESLAIGAAYAAMADICRARKEDPRDHLKPLKNAYLGPDTERSGIGSVVDKARMKGYRISGNPSSRDAARLISGKKILARCAGRSEFGARALGNRSIIADPRDPAVVKIINEKIKCRDFWMPFAPSILEEKADEYLINEKNLKAPYMTVAFETKPKAHSDLKAGLHQYDLTARPQIVSRKDNPAYHDIISEFHKLTGVGGVLNTSFNIHGDPIVQTPAEAFEVFEKTGLDALLLDGYLITRAEEKSG